MTQTIDNSIFQELEKEMNKKEKKENFVSNSGAAKPGSWTEKIVSRIRISKLAEEQGIDCCPFCQYEINFNDGWGSFICIKAKYEPQKCDFKGNIVDFVDLIGGLR